MNPNHKGYITCFAFLVCICIFACSQFIYRHPGGSIMPENIKNQITDNRLGLEMCQTDSQTLIPIEKIETAVVSGPVPYDLKEVISQSLVQLIACSKKNHRFLSQSKCYLSGAVNLSPMISKLQI
jgi:hypothetical protein